MGDFVKAEKEKYEAYVAAQIRPSRMPSPKRRILLRSLAPMPMAPMARLVPTVAPMATATATVLAPLLQLAMAIRMVPLATATATAVATPALATTIKWWLETSQKFHQLARIADWAYPKSLERPRFVFWKWERRRSFPVAFL